MDVVDADELSCDLQLDFGDESLVEIDDDEDDGDEDEDDDGNGRDVVAQARNIAVLSDEEREYIIDMIFNRGMPVSRLSQEIGCTKEAVYGVTRAFRAYNRQRTLGDRASKTAAAADTPSVASAKSASSSKPETASPINKTTTTTKKGNTPVMNKMYNQQEEEVLLKKFIRTNNCTSVKELQDYINGESDTFPGIRSLSKRTLYRILKRCRSDCSTQNVAAAAAAAASDARLLQERLKYVHEMSRLEKLNPTKIVFVDICGYELTSEPSTVMMPISGDVGSDPNSRGGAVSICVALSERGILHASFKLKPFTTENFLGFLRELAKKLPKGKHVFVLDPASANKVPAVQNYFKVSGNVLKYLPKGSPFLNPLHEGFAAIKARACLSSTIKRPRNAVAALAAARQAITADLSRLWITNTRLYYEKCLKSELVLKPRVKPD